LTQAIQSLRSKLITRRTYNRPLDDAGTVFETFEQTVDRVIGHQIWLWKRAAKFDKMADVERREFAKKMYAELDELKQLMLERKVLMSGRTLWLGGTDVAKQREASQFNCAFTHVETVYDLVDSLWLLMQGCGVGFRPIIGQLTGFQKPIKEIEVIRSTRTEKGGLEYNTETYDEATGVWTIQVMGKECG
jgi:ribonucleoside-triphosphate reductase (formate)